MMRTHVTAYQIADRVLSGLPAFPPPEPVLELDPTRVEPKLCEMCPKTFFRPIGSKKSTCGCDLHRPRKAKARYRTPLIRTFDATGFGTSKAYRQGWRLYANPR